MHKRRLFIAWCFGFFDAGSVAGLRTRNQLILHFFHITGVCLGPSRRDRSRLIFPDSLVRAREGDVSGLMCQAEVYTAEAIVCLMSGFFDA